MRHQLPDNDHGNLFAVVIETGDEAVSCLQKFVCANNILAAEPTGIGAFAQATLGYVNWFTNLPHEQVEVASLVGDVAFSLSDEPILHIHRSWETGRSGACRSVAEGSRSANAGGDPE